jgi:long-chain acyl-CoA synthetase
LLYDIFVKEDTYLAFLPLAHILEFVVENSFIFAGMPIGYGRVKTLADASVRECKGDLTEFKPVSYRPLSEVFELIGRVS